MKGLGRFCVKYEVFTLWPPAIHAGSDGRASIVALVWLAAASMDSSVSYYFERTIRLYAQFSIHRHGSSLSMLV